MALRLFFIKAPHEIRKCGRGKRAAVFSQRQRGENADGLRAANAERPSYARLARRRLQERKSPEIKQPPFAGGCFISGLSLTALVLPGKTVNKIGGVCRKAKNLPYGAQGQIGLYFSVQNAQAFYSKCRDFRKKTKKLEKTLKRHESCVTINMCSNIAFFGRIGAGSVRRFMV